MEADCKNMQCPFRVNGTSNRNRCDSYGCERRHIDSYGYIISNRTLTDEELRELSRRRKTDG